MSTLPYFFPSSPSSLSLDCASDLLSSLLSILICLSLQLAACRRASPLCCCFCCLAASAPSSPPSPKLPPPLPLYPSSHLPLPPPQRHVDWAEQSCQSPIRACRAARPGRRKGAGGKWCRGVAVGPVDLPPLSSGPPQQIEPPAGEHGAHSGPMLGAHMPRNTNSQLQTNTHTHMHMCDDAVLTCTQTQRSFRGAEN